ncbi:glutamate--tRNA ligase [bacterium]|nr:glutamate--tRNA ligase [bacterium]
MERSSGIRVRFAPSPTGWLHIGGARTALFNWLFARHNDGKFLLRVEDTDRERSNAEMTQGILDSLRWLGLDWDEEIVYQSKGINRHKAIVQNLIDNNKAYRCFCSTDELKEKREAAEKSGGAYLYDGLCRDLSKETIAQKIDENIPYTIRFRMPEGSTEFDDTVRNNVCVQNRELDDFIILRSDGTPVYQVAVVVDDHDMGITHVIRGDDHLSNAPKQIQIYRALNWEVPCFGHVPMILGPDKKRLSKRHGATSVSQYKTDGFLAEALINYLALLSWSPGDDREILSRNELIDAFTVERISRNASVFDVVKLEWMNAKYIHSLSNIELLEELRPDMDAKALSSVSDKFMLQLISLLKERMKRITDFNEQSHYFFTDPVDFEEKAVKKHWLKEGVAERLSIIIKKYESIENWNEQALEDVLRNLAEELEVGAGKLIHPVRLAVSGLGNTPGIFEVLVLLGRESVIRRLYRGVEWIKSKS